MFSFVQKFSRYAVVLVISASFISGCSWFRSRPEYEGLDVAKPLVVPSDLSKPMQRDALHIPSKTLIGANAKSNEMLSSFSLNEEPGKAWLRIGTALATIDGVEVLNKAESIKSYEVRYVEETFLIAAQANGAITRITTIGNDGAESNSMVAGQLLAQLKAKLK